MKCLVFIFSLCSLGTFIDVQGGTETNRAELFDDHRFKPILDKIIEDDWDHTSHNEDESSSESSSEDKHKEEGGTGKTSGKTTNEDSDDDDDDDESYSKYSKNTCGNKEQHGTGKTHVKITDDWEEHHEEEDSESSSSSGEEAKINLAGPSNREKTKITKEVMRQYLIEVAAGDQADLLGSNQHIRQSKTYNDLGRRSEPQDLKNNVPENVPGYLIPQKASPELVLRVAKESRLLRAGKDKDWDDFDQDKILRSGNYWDGVWKEEVIPKTSVRSAAKDQQLGSVKAKINPGTEFYKVVSRMKKISPKLLYIINEN